MTTNVNTYHFVAVWVVFFTAYRTVKILPGFFILLRHGLVCEFEVENCFDSTLHIEEMFHSYRLIPPIFDEQRPCEYFRQRCFLNHFVDPLVLVLDHIRSFDKLVR